MSEIKVGVLALQGAYAKHIDTLNALRVRSIEVRKPKALAECDALIIPGGESTTMMNRISFADFEKPLQNFAREKPVFGTCAGLILMAKELAGDTMKPFGWLDVIVERNAFGSQADSFRTSLSYSFGHGRKNQTIEATFIRAPRIMRCGPEVKVHAHLNGEPVLVQQGNHLAAAFHPELTDNLSIHRYFLDIIKKSKI